MQEKAKELSEILKLISNPNRLLILCALQEGEKDVGSICRSIPDISMAAISQHLSALKLAGILESEKRGLNIYYHIKNENILKLMEALKDIYCK